MLDCRMNSEVLLEITDSQTMSIHHTITWDILNTGDEAMPGTDFMASSVIKRTLDGINLKAHDGKNRQLKALPKINQPFSKAFFIKFDSPLPVSSREKVVIEYDWEEPDRQYVYIFQFPCDNFGIRMIAPKELQIKPVIQEAQFSNNPAMTHKRKEWSITGKADHDNSVSEWSMRDIAPPMGYRILW